MDARYQIDGPHTPDLLLSAADDLAELVRYLNHATLANRAGDSLPDPNTVARLLGDLGTALEHLPQLIGHIIERLADFEEHPGLRASDGLHPTAVVEDAVAYLVGSGLDEEAANLHRAQSYVDRLYLDGDDRD